MTRCCSMPARKSGRGEPLLRGDDVGRAVAGRGQEVEPAAVGEGRGVQEGAAGRDPVDLRVVVQGHRHQVAVAQRRALGPSGGARGVEEPGGVVVGDVDQRVARRGERLLVGLPDLEHADVVGERVHRGRGVGGDDDRRCATVPDDVVDLVGVQVPVQRDGDEAAPESGPQRLDQLRCVGHQQHDPVAAPQADRPQPALSRATRSTSCGWVRLRSPNTTAACESSARAAPATRSWATFTVPPMVRSRRRRVGPLRGARYAAGRLGAPSEVPTAARPASSRATRTGSRPHSSVMEPEHLALRFR